MPRSRRRKIKQPKPIERNPYDRLPPPERGNETADPIFTAKGRALDRWELVEEELSTLFATFTFSHHPAAQEAVRRAYGSIATFRGRAEMLEAAGEIFFKTVKDKTLLKPWTALSNECPHYSARRNEIAHGITLKLEFKDPHAPPRDETFYLFPTFYGSKTRLHRVPAVRSTHVEGDLRERLLELQRTGHGTYKYNADQINYYADEFLKLRKRVAELVSALRAMRISSRKKSE